MQIGYSLKFLVSANTFAGTKRFEQHIVKGVDSPADVQMFWYTPPINALMKREPLKSLAMWKGFYWHDWLESRYLNDISKATEMHVHDIPFHAHSPKK